MLGFGDAMYRDPHDGPDVRVLRQQVVRARKDHKCVLCPDPIVKGQLYTRVVSIDYDNGGKFLSEAYHGGLCPNDIPEE